jgi:hypothetical protein
MSVAETVFGRLADGGIVIIDGGMGTPWSTRGWPRSP